MKKKIVVISVLLGIAIILLVGVFVVQILNNKGKKVKENIFEKNVIDPDRMVYRNQEGKYYEFFKDTEEYDKIKNLISDLIESYNKNGEVVDEKIIDDIHGKSFIEFDYKTASKNYIISLEKNEDRNFIKLENTGGIVWTAKIKDLNKIKKLVEDLSKDRKSYFLEYKEMLSRNHIETMEYKYLQQFKLISHRIYQVKIQDIDTYYLYKEMCNLAFDEKITEKTFEDNDLILTVSLAPKISVKVNVGNIRYSYENIENFGFQYVAHALVVSKIVNTDCIYNTDFAEIDNRIQYDNVKVENDRQVNNLDSEIFVIDFEQFYEEYRNSSTTVTEEQAKETAEKGFEEAKRIAGAYNKESEKITSEIIYPNNFFTRKTEERDFTYKDEVEVYSFTRIDDMGLNGVRIYVDKKLGKIVGAESFGD